MSSYSLFSYLIEPIIARLYSFISAIKYSDKDEEDYFAKLNSSFDVKGPTTINNNKNSNINENIFNNLFRNYTKNVEKNDDYIKNEYSKSNNNFIKENSQEKLTQSLLGKKTKRVNIKTAIDSNNEFINDFNNVNENVYNIIKETPNKIENNVNDSQNIFKNNENNDFKIEGYEIYKNKDNESILNNKEFININKMTEEEIRNNKNDNIEFSENEKEININDSTSIKINSINGSFIKSKKFNGNLFQTQNDSFSYIINRLKKINIKNNFTYQKENDFSYKIPLNIKSDKIIIEEKSENKKENFSPVNEDKIFGMEVKNNKYFNNSKEIKQIFEPNNIFINNFSKKEEIKSNLFNNNLKNKHNSLFCKNGDIKNENIKENDNNKLLSKGGLF